MEIIFIKDFSMKAPPKFYKDSQLCRALNIAQNPTDFLVKIMEIV